MSKKNPRRTQRRRPPTARRLPDKRLVLLDRHQIAWQDATRTWRGSNRLEADVCLMAEAPANFHITAVLQPGHPYAWIGIDPDPTDDSRHAPRQCFATISGDTLLELAREVLRYVPATTTGRAR